MVAVFRVIAFMGEMGSLRVVKTENIKPFDGAVVEEDGVEYAKEMMSQLDDCMTMTRRIQRGLQKGSVGIVKMDTSA